MSEMLLEGVPMSDKNRANPNDKNKTDEDKAQGVQPNPNVGQDIDDKTKNGSKGNPAGQGYEDEDVMPAGRETPG